MEGGIEAPSGRLFWPTAGAMLRTAPGPSGSPHENPPEDKCGTVRVQPKGEGGRGPHKGPALTLYGAARRVAGFDPGKGRTDDTEDKCGTVRVAAMTRPTLREIPLAEAIPLKPGELTVTMSQGQWSRVLQAAYDSGCVLLELDDQERPARAYQRAGQPGQAS